DSNRYTLCALLERLGVDVLDYGVVVDTAEATRDVFERASKEADAVISSGGASVSDADHVSRTLGVLGEVAFWRLAMRPGRPLACGKVGDALFFGLPGNPVAVMVTFYQFVQP
ncbi:MAG: molybdopterin-binding protein, partial [Granulosicoccaceae bacterium]